MSGQKFCPQCGDPADPNQRFCEKCGAQIPVTPGAPNAPTTMPMAPMTPTTMGGVGLFDKSHMAYVIKEKFWGWGSGPIYDATGREIGKMQRKVISIRGTIEFYELNGTLAASINQKLIAIKPTYDLHDANDAIIGRFSKTLFSMFRPKFELKYPDSDNILMNAQGEVFGFDFTIYRGAGKNPQDALAEIHKADRWRDVFFSGAWNFSDTYGVKIIDPNIDRRLVIGFVIAIDNVLHDQK